MNVICFDEPAFYAVIEQVYSKLAGNSNSAEPKRWITATDAMQLLNIKSKTSLQHLRDNGKIRYTQPQKKVILYDRQSIEEYLEKHAKQTF